MESINTAADWLASADKIFSLGDHAKAVSYYEKALASQPSADIAFWSHRNLAISLRSVGRAKMAISHFDAAAQLRPDYIDLQLEKAITLLLLKEEDEAKEVFSNFLRVSPENFGAWTNLADIYQSRQQDLRAIACYKKAISLNPSHFWSMRNIGLSYIKLREYEKAINFFNNSEFIAPLDNDHLADIKFFIGDCFSFQKKNKEAADIFSKCWNGTSIGKRFGLTEAYYCPELKYIYVGGWIVSEGKIKSSRIVISGSEAFPLNMGLPPMTVARRTMGTEFTGYSFWVEIPFPYHPTSMSVEADHEIDGKSYQESIQITNISRAPVIQLDQNYRQDSKDNIGFYINLGDNLQGKDSLYMHVVFCYRTALQIAEQAIEKNISPDIVVSITLKAGDILYQNNRYHEAVALLEKGVLYADRGALDYVSIGKCFDLLCASIWKIHSNNYGMEKIESLCYKYSNHPMLQAHASLNLAHVRINQDRRAEADSLYEQAVLRLPSLPLHFSIAAHVFRNDQFVDAVAYQSGSSTSSHPIVHFQDVYHSSPKLVHCIGCDSGYFLRFFPMLAASLQTADMVDDIVLHAHVVNPDSNVLETLVDTRRACHPVSLSFSGESIDTSGLGHYAKKAYYTLPRFLISEQIISKFNAPVLITETDAIINWRKEEIFSWLCDADVGLVCGDADLGFAPWTKIPAGIVYLNNTVNGKKFARFLREYIKKSHAFSSINNWGVDQLAIWEGWRRFKDSMSIKQIPMQLICIPSGNKDDFVKKNIDKKN